MGSILTIFSGPYAVLARLAVVAIVLVTAFVTGWVKGNEHGTQKLTDYQGKQATESLKVITKQGEATERVVTQYVQVAGKTKVVTETVEKEVTKYVDSKPLALACMLDNRWLRLHDAAAANAVPPTAAADDAATGTISAAQALPTITGNYAAGNRTSDRLEALQGWVRQQYKATNGKELGY